MEARPRRLTPRPRIVPPYKVASWHVPRPGASWASFVAADCGTAQLPGSAMGEPGSLSGQRDNAKRLVPDCEWGWLFISRTA
jgi:hypothetical protein